MKKNKKSPRKRGRKGEGFPKLEQHGFTPEFLDDFASLVLEVEEEWSKENQAKLEAERVAPLNPGLMRRGNPPNDPIGVLHTAGPAIILVLQGHNDLGTQLKGFLEGGIYIGGINEKAGGHWCPLCG